MNPEPLAELFRSWGQHAIDGLKRVATHSARNLKSKFKIGIEKLATKIFKNYGIGIPDEEYKKSVLFVCESIYNDLFGNIDMTLFETDCDASHPDDQYNTRANASDARRDCARTNIAAVAEHYKVQIEYVFKMQQLSVHPDFAPNELITPTDFDRMIFIIDLMCSSEPISYELGTREEEFLRGYKTAKCGEQIQHVATVKYNRRGNPKKPEYSALKVVGRPFGKIKTMEDVARYSPALSSTWRRDTKKYFKKQPLRKLTAIPEELATDLTSGKFKMSSNIRSQLSASTKKAIKTATENAKKKSQTAAASSNKEKTLKSFGFTSTRKGGRKHKKQ
jgi:hypothetical protein